MKQIEAIKAYKVLVAHGQDKIPIEAAYKLFNLKRALRPAFEFQAEQEKAISERFNATLDDEGYFHCDTPENGQAMRKEMDALGETECTIDVEPVELDMVPELTFSINDLESLEPVLRFIQ